MTTLSFKVTEAEARTIRREARREKLSVSEFLRRRAGTQVAGSSKPRLVRCPHTGAMVFAPVEDRPPLTTEVVRELLTDFP